MSTIEKEHTRLPRTLTCLGTQIKWRFRRPFCERLPVLFWLVFSSVCVPTPSPLAASIPARIGLRSIAPFGGSPHLADFWAKVSPQGEGVGAIADRARETAGRVRAISPGRFTDREAGTSLSPAVNNDATPTQVWHHSQRLRLRAFARARSLRGRALPSVHPHPRPLPRGEGVGYAPSRSCSCSCSISPRSRTSSRSPSPLPSPAGRGSRVLRVRVICVGTGPGRRVRRDAGRGSLRL